MTAARIDTDIIISDTQWHGSKKQISDLPDHAKGLVREQLEIPPIHASWARHCPSD